MAGLYNRRVTPMAGRTVENESIVNVPNWLPLNFQIDEGPWFDVGDVELLDYSQELDLRRATLTRSLRLQDAAGRVTRVDQRRFVSMSDPHSGRPRNASVRRKLVRSPDGPIRPSTDGSPMPEWLATASSTRTTSSMCNTRCRHGETIALTARTSQSDVSIAEAATHPGHPGRDSGPTPRSG